MAAGELSGTLEVVGNDAFELRAVSWRLVQESQPPDPENPGQKEQGPGQSVAPTKLIFEAASARLGDHRLETIRLTCGRVLLGPRQQRCEDGLLSFNRSGQIIEAQIQGGWSEEAGWQLAVEGAGPGAPSARLALTESGGVWRVNAERLSVDLAAVAALVELPLSPQSGQLAGTGHVELGPEIALEFAGRLDGLGFDSPDGTKAGADLATTLWVQATQTGGQWAFSGQLEALAGELLWGDLYLSLGEIPDLSIGVTGTLDANGDWAMDRIETRDRDSLLLEASAESAGEHLNVDLQALRMAFPQAYDRYLATLLDARGLGPYRMQGVLRAAGRLQGGNLEHLALDMESLVIDDERQRFSIHSLDGRLAMDGAPSRLQWSAAQVYAVPVAAGGLNLAVTPERLDLLEPARLELLGGALEVAEFALGFRPGQGLDDLSFRGAIEPMDLAALTRVLDWPEFGGTLSGEIPRVRLRDGVVEVEGDIRMSVFDGEAVLGRLRLERLFGVLPTLAADIRVDDIDLAQLTSAFSFGRIDGRLDGRVSGLRLLNWEPVAFDLNLGTDEDEPGKRRISQRAVDNLSSIGGGATAALSQTFLRVFDDFGYRRLGIRCQLANHVCRMGGVGDAPNGGYYIVEGRGLPRIDVIGYSGQVDWPQLLRRLDAATRAAPSID